LAVTGQIQKIAPGQSLLVNPKSVLAIKGLTTNRWRNYDLFFFASDFDVNALVKEGGASLVGLFGPDAFLEPKTVTVEVREGPKTVASFSLKGAFTAGDFGFFAQNAVEPDRKIEYYRKALALEPTSVAFAAGLRAALEAGGQKDELISLLEEDLTKANDQTQEEILNRLLALYRAKPDPKRTTATLARLLSLAEKTGETVKAQNFKIALAGAYKDQDPKKAVDLYESLTNSSEAKVAKASLVELLALYKTDQNKVKEEDVYLRLLPYADSSETLGLWAEIVRLREVRGDKVGQALAYEKLAELSPPGLAKANAYKRLGYLWYESQDYAASEKAYLLALKEDENDPAVYRNLAGVALAKEDRVSYRNYLAKALTLKDQPALRLELAKALTEDGLKTEAARHWEVLANLNGQAAEDLKLKDLAQSQLVGLYRPPDGETSEEFERVLWRHSQESVEFYNLGVANFQKKDFDKAQRAFLRAIELKPEEPLAADAHGYLLALYKETGQTQKMLNEANWLYPADPKRKEVRDLLAHYFETAKDWAGLAKAATEWTGQDDEAENWRYLALAQSRLDRNKDAAQSLLKAAQRDSKATAWLNAAQALEKVGQKAEAKLAYERARDLDPDNLKAEEALIRLAMESLAKDRAKNNK
jgi:tetratricopeptide (TPR) repeat protein